MDIAVCVSPGEEKKLEESAASTRQESDAFLPGAFSHGESIYAKIAKGSWT